jgi:glycerol-3-phosphate acyltransferase PlsY
VKVLFCALVGYLLGSISPSALIAKIKKKDIRKSGTKNLGAMNTLIHFGKAWGVFVMLFDIMKAVIAVKIAKYFVPSLLYAGFIAGGAAVIGHMFPFYMRFKGGKGLAPFAGFVLGNNPLVFLFLLVCCVTLMFIVNYSVALPYSASVLYPFMAGYATRDLNVFLLALPISIVMLVKFRGNLMKAIRREDTKVRDFVRIQFSK